MGLLSIYLYMVGVAHFFGGQFFFFFSHFPDLIEKENSLFQNYEQKILEDGWLVSSYANTKSTLTSLQLNRGKRKEGKKKKKKKIHDLNTVFCVFS